MALFVVFKATIWVRGAGPSGFSVSLQRRGRKMLKVLRIILVLEASFFKPTRRWTVLYWRQQVCKANPRRLLVLAVSPASVSPSYYRASFFPDVDIILPRRWYMFICMNTFLKHVFKLLPFPPSFPTPIHPCFLSIWMANWQGIDKTVSPARPAWC